MIRFEFDLPDDQADLLLGCVQSAVTKALTDALDYEKFSPEERAWLIRHSELIATVRDIVARGSKKL